MNWLLKLRYGLALSFCAFGVACNTYVHTAHTPVVPVALEQKGLLTTGSVDISGASAEVQYYLKDRWSLVGALQGGSRSYSSFSTFGLGGGGQLYRTDWNTVLGTCYLLGGKDRSFYFPLQAGLMGGGTKQVPESVDVIGNFHGRHLGTYVQVGWLIHADWFQAYAGYQFNFNRYVRPETTLLTGRNLRLEYSQFIGQMGFLINKHYFFKTYLVLAGPVTSVQMIDQVQTVWPGVNIGAGFGINLNSPPKGEK